MITIATNILGVIAQAAAPGTTAPAGSGQPQPFFNSVAFPLMIVMVIWMFFTFNSKRKQDKQRQALLASMKRGDRVQTIGGILGTIVEVRDNEIVVKVDESNNTKIKFARSAVNRVISEEEKAEVK